MQESNPNRFDLDKRRSARVPLTVLAKVSSVVLGYSPLPARLRDVSAAGAYFYADMTPELGMTIRIDFNVLVSGREMGVTCEGTVVRIDLGASRGSTGIALQGARYHLVNL